VFIVEGERDADALVARGLVATTSPQGAGNWQPEYTAQLVAAGVRELVILPDNDPAGAKHAETVARSCLVAGLPAKMVRLPGLLPKGDVSDWLARGHTRADLLELTARATGWTVDADTPANRPAVGGLTLTPIGELLAEPEDECAWLVAGLLPAG